MDKIARIKERIAVFKQELANNEGNSDFELDFDYTQRHIVQTKIDQLAWVLELLAQGDED